MTFTNICTLIFKLFKHWNLNIIMLKSLKLYCVKVRRKWKQYNCNFVFWFPSFYGQENIYFKTLYRWKFLKVHVFLFSRKFRFSEIITATIFHIVVKLGGREGVYHPDQPPYLRHSPELLVWSQNPNQNVIKNKI